MHHAFVELQRKKRVDGGRRVKQIRCKYNCERRGCHAIVCLVPTYLTEESQKPVNDAAVELGHLLHGLNALLPSLRDAIYDRFQVWLEHGLGQLFEPKLDQLRNTVHVAQLVKLTRFDVLPRQAERACCGRDSEDSLTQLPTMLPQYSP